MDDETRNPKLEEMKALYEQGTFVFDNNVLINLISYKESTREDYFKTFRADKIKDRVWMPFQVVLEFITNFHKPLKNEESKFNEVREIYKKQIQALETIARKTNAEIISLDLLNQHTILVPEDCTPKKLCDEPIKQLNTLLGKLVEIEKQQLTKEQAQAIQDEIIGIFDGKIGSCFSKSELKEIFAEGEERYSLNIPPGYTDVNKINKDTGKFLYKTFEDKTIISKFGDLIIWKEIIRYARECELEYLLFVTDEKKPDWFIIDDKNNNKGPRRELLNEIYYEVPTLKVFHITSSANFLTNSKEISGIEIKDSSIKESEISFTEPVQSASVDKAALVSQIIDETFQQFAPELKLSFKDDPSQSLGFMAYPGSGITPFLTRHPRTFKTVIALILEFINRINLSKIVHYRYINLFHISGGHSFEFSSDFWRKYNPIDTTELEKAILDTYPGVKIIIEPFETEQRNVIYPVVYNVRIQLVFSAENFFVLA